MKKRQVIPHTEGKELEFPTLEDRQEWVFRHSVNYVVTTKPKTVGRRDRLEYRTFLEAMMVVIHLTNKAEEEGDWNNLPILYIVDHMGGNFNMPYDQLPKYLKIYNEIAGTKYVMPAIYQPKPKVEKRNVKRK